MAKPLRKQAPRGSAAKKRPSSAARRPPALAGGRAPWLLLTAAVAVGVVTLVWLTGRPGGQGGGQPAGGTLAVGQPAPPVRLPATTGKTIDVNDFRGKRNVLLYFYEHTG